MTLYQRRSLNVDDEGYVESEGRIVEVLGAPRRGLDSVVALVELPDGATREDYPEGVAEEGKKATCSGKDGECSRTVDETGDRCWQHPPDEE
jgi:hypothetical protein